MTWAAHFRAASEADMQAARDWYESEAPVQVDRLRADLDAAVARACAHPTLIAPFHGELRRVFLKVFPYQLWYLAHPDLELIEVVAFVHDRQDPTRFTTRATQ
jgi:plasmid stabilization system protein ParE